MKNKIKTLMNEIENLRKSMTYTRIEELEVKNTIINKDWKLNILKWVKEDERIS